MYALQRNRPYCQNKSTFTKHHSHVIFVEHFVWVTVSQLVHFIKTIGESFSYNAINQNRINCSDLLVNEGAFIGKRT